MKTAQRIILVTFILVIVSVTAALLIPLPASQHGNWAGFHIPLAASLVFAILSIGASVLFIKGLGVYKLELRRVYRGIVLGIISLSLGALQLPILNGFSWWDTAWATYGFMGIPFILSGTATYLAMRKLAHLVGTKTIWTSAKFAVPVAIIGAGIAVLMPHAPLQSSGVAFNSYVAVDTFSWLLFVVGALISVRITQDIGAHYVQAMRALTVALFTTAAVGAALMIQVMLSGDVKTTSPVILALTNIDGILLVYAGFLFVKTAGERTRGTEGWFSALFGASNTGVLQAGSTVLDMVTYTAGLASNPSTIDPVLDKVRSITAGLKPGQALSKIETDQLLGVYLTIEHYLTTKEPIRAFTRQDLRTSLIPHLRNQIETYEKEHKQKS